MPIANNDKDPAVRQLCCDAISSVFSSDKSGSPSLNLVKTIARLAKKQGPRKLQVEFIATLLSLRYDIFCSSSYNFSCCLDAFSCS